MGARPVSRRAVSLAVLVAGLTLIVGGIALISLPLGMIAAGVALIGVLTFDPVKAGRVTWPR